MGKKRARAATKRVRRLVFFWDAYAAWRAFMFPAFMSEGEKRWWHKAEQELRFLFWQNHYAVMTVCVREAEIINLNFLHGQGNSWCKWIRFVMFLHNKLKDENLKVGIMRVIFGPKMLVSQEIKIFSFQTLKQYFTRMRWWPSKIISHRQPRLWLSGCRTQDCALGTKWAPSSGPLAQLVRASC